MTVKTLKVADIVADPAVQIRDRNHSEERLQHYMEIFDKLPPVDVFDTKEGMLLSDGFGRWAAAERLGRKAIQAKVIKGSREDALEHAVTANMTHGDPLTVEERELGIRRLRELHPKWGLREIADAMSVSHETVRRVFKVEELRKTVPVTRVTRSTLREIAAAPKENWEPLAEAAERREWTRDEASAAVRSLKDPRIPKSTKADLLAGKIDPPVFDRRGEPAFHRDTVGRTLADFKRNDIRLAVEKALDSVGKLDAFKASAILDSLGPDRIRDLYKELPHYIGILESLRTAAGKALASVKVAEA